MRWQMILIVLMDHGCACQLCSIHPPPAAAWILSPIAPGPMLVQPV
jgi:hypothetical protein